jgi:hypothetical protein
LELGFLMNDCCKKTLEEEYREIHEWKPFLHWCPEWDYLLIDKSDGEFEVCTCFERDAKGQPIKPRVP